ncbi:hypothetical protein SAY86_019835 [Trapa natans]|uniref:TCP domain-containing protein n=1 Tax=Trapa natans TaxID=22666 RepID=A0AAN7LLL4_TRANT|nr:hypothetical protein SAY86_019835 [Trapa natans]
MFPYNSLSDLHLQYTEKTPTIGGRSYSPFSPRLYGLDLDDELIFEQLLFQEEQITEDNSGGHVNLMTGSYNTLLETSGGVDLSGIQVSPDRSLHQKACPSKKARCKVVSSKKSQLTSRKRTGKKDRHSKIRTAQGLRDRRIRLSVHIARKFFDLQEMLCLDKASKTIEWLLAESQGAIDELSKKKYSDLNVDSTPESAMELEIKEAENEEEEEEEEDEEEEEEEEEEVQRCEEGKKRKVIDSVKRDSHGQSRSRARKRTRKDSKMKELSSGVVEQSHEKRNPNHISLDDGFLGQPENGRNPSHLDAYEMNSLSIIEKFLGITSTAMRPNSSCPDFSSGSDCYPMIGGVDFP